jgi:hypothetical protein
MATIGPLSTYLENSLINHLLRNTSFASPSPVYVALYTVSPTETRAGIEVSGNGYARQTAAFTVSGSYASNTSLLTFPEATGNWGTVIGVGIMDASTAGNMLFWGDIDNATTINAGESYIINVGMLNIGLRGGARGGWGNGMPQQILNHVLGNSSYSSPGTNVYIACGNSLVTDTSYTFVSWTEISTSGTGYARKAATSWYAPTSGSTSNLSDVLFATPPLGVTWGRITHVAVFNAISGGNMLVWGRLRAPIYIIAGDGLKFASGDIDVSIS